MSRVLQTRLGAEIDFDLDDLQAVFRQKEVPRRQSKAASVVLSPSRALAAPTPAAHERPLFAFNVDSQLGADGGGAAARRVIAGRILRTTVPFVIGDLFALAVAGLIAQFVVSMIRPHQLHVPPWVFPAAMCPLLIAYLLTGLYSEIWVHPVIELRQLTHLTSIGLLAAAGGGFVVPWFPLWCLSAWPAALVLVPLCRAIVRKCCAGRDWWGYPTLVIDSGGGRGALIRALLRSPKSGLRPVMMTDPRSQCRVSPVPVINDPNVLRSLVRAEGICHAVISLPDLTTAEVTAALDRYSGVIPHLLVLSDASTVPALWSASRGLGRLSGIEVRNGLLLATLQRAKRLTDIAVCLAVVVLGLPLLAMIVGALKLTDPGPIFFGHTRIGQHGRRFKTWKFRTMRVGSDKLLGDYLIRNPSARAEWELSQKLRDDPRITWIGRFLRRTSLDELPQVWNVLRGEMSLVGPRPIVDEEVRHYGNAISLYAMVKPGITGLWQASGRTELGYRDRVLLDQFYVRHWSPWLDVFVLAKTIIALLRRDGAY